MICTITVPPKFVFLSPHVDRLLFFVCLFFILFVRRIFGNGYLGPGLTQGNDIFRMVDL